MCWEEEVLCLFQGYSRILPKSLTCFSWTLNLRVWWAFLRGLIHVSTLHIRENTEGKSYWNNPTCCTAATRGDDLTSICLFSCISIPFCHENMFCRNIEGTFLSWISAHKPSLAVQGWGSESLSGLAWVWTCAISTLLCSLLASHVSL